LALCELSFTTEYQDLDPSFSLATKLFHDSGLFPIIFQDYGRTLSPYSWERDVIFVKKELLNNIWGW